MVGEGEYVVDYDRQGMVRARFVIPKDQKPWSIIDFLNEKVLVKFPGSQFYKIKRNTFNLDVNKSQWVVRWSYPNYQKRSMIQL